MSALAVSQRTVPDTKENESEQFYSQEDQVLNISCTKGVYISRINKDPQTDLSEVALRISQIKDVSMKHNAHVSNPYLYDKNFSWVRIGLVDGTDYHVACCDEGDRKGAQIASQFFIFIKNCLKDR